MIPLPIPVKDLLAIGAGLLLLVGLAWGVRTIWRDGYDTAKAESVEAEQRERIAVLELALSQEAVAASIGQQTREAVVIEAGRINVQVENRMEVVRAGFDGRPVCPVPVRVRSQQQEGIDAANAAARGLRRG